MRLSFRILIVTVCLELNSLMLDSHTEEHDHHQVVQSAHVLDQLQADWIRSEVVTSVSQWCIEQ